MSVTDRAEVADLFARLANLLDEHRPDDAGAVYHQDVEVHSPKGELRGLDAVITLLRQSRVEGEHTQHVHGDVLVDVDGDHARATANQLVFFYRPGEKPHRRSGLRVAFAAVRTAAGWRISDMRITVLWTESAS